MSSHSATQDNRSTRQTARHLLVVRQYPSYDQLYKYPFVHRRVLAYSNRGMPADVFSLDQGGGHPSYEFEGVTCNTGTLEQLDNTIANGNYQSVIVHGMSKDYWPVLKKHLKTTRIIGWIHGSEVHPLFRFDSLNPSKSERNELEENYAKIVRFWQDLLDPMPENLELVFVSQFARKFAETELGLNLDQKKCHVVANPIDTDLFNYVEKTPDQRLKILSIRPFDKSFYANDLSVKAILSLSKKSFFNELEFLIIGKGPLFEQTVAPLKGLSNVTVKEQFIRQHEIAALHKTHGVFLVPTRMDTHGVSRDEAMSSGLVAITSHVAAVPEYADKSCAFLAKVDAFQPLADAIEKLYHQPDLFLKMSKAAAQKVRSNSGQDLAIPKEMDIIEPDRNHQPASPIIEKS